MLLSDLGLFIRKERKAAGLTIQRLSELAGVDRTILSKLENERLPEMGYAKLERVLSILGFELTARPTPSLPTLNDLQRQNREH